ncbi:hypothetical protein BX666DRAFT_1234344 [Dichotomocladium elegans]|nr:hypothetical protein BX666DRAFT_1234344 [Dichotomocladium elegans]
MTPLLQQQQLGDWHSETNIGGQAGSKPALFPLTDLLLDDLHLSFPCSEDTLKVLKRNGIREATFRLCESMHSRRLLDNTNQYPFVHLEGARPAHLFGELITINLRFMMQPHDDDALNGIYDKFLYTFLQDAQTRKHMDRIMTSKNHAFFHLAAFPEYPVEMRLSRDQSSSNLFIMTISCYNDVALIKVETSLLARSQDFVVDSEEITDKGIHLHDAHWELLNASTNLEQRYRSNKNDPEFWKALKETVGHLKKLHDGLVIGPIWF